MLRRLLLTHRLALAAPLCAIAALAAWQPARAAADRPLTPERAVKFRRASDLHFSPDGAVVVAVVSEVNGPGFESHLWLADLARHELRQFTFSQKSERLPQWAPRAASDRHAGSDALAFLSNRAGVTQIYSMSLTGGEARALTNSPTNVSDFRWSPDGKQIAYLTREGSVEQDRNAPHVADREQAVPRLWVLDLASGRTRALTDGSVRIEAIAWPNLEQLVVIGSEQPKLETWHSALYAISSTDGKRTVIGKPPQPFSDLWPSPSGKQLAFLGTRSGGPIPHDLFLQAASNDTAHDITAAIDRSILEARWQSETSVVVRVQDGFATRLVRVDTRGAASAIELPYSVRAFDVAPNGTVIFAGVGFNQLPELFARSNRGSIAQIGHLQSGWEGIHLLDAEVFRCKSFDGLEIEAALLRPPNVPSPGRKSPLVVLAHGGPASAFSADYFWFNAWPQLLAARGYYVLMVNPRGSTGYGEAFVKANRGDLGGGDFQDILAALNTVIARGNVDETRLGIGGWSYGAQMTQWAITHTDRFKAAVSGAGVFDEASEFATEESFGSASDEWYLGTPWEHPDVYARNSPSTFIGHVKTPTLIVHGEDDPVNPVGQSQALYRAMKRLGIEAELVTYPGEPHLPRQEQHQVDILKRMLDWYDRHLDVTSQVPGSS